MWHGQDDIAGKVLGQLADDFNRTHKDIHVNATTGGVVADQMRQKVTTALASGEYPDIAYIFGSDLANLARSDKVMDLTDDVNEPDFGWDDYYTPARDATMVDGRVRALPALIDDLAVVYNKKLFAAAGVRRAAPRAGRGTTSSPPRRRSPTVTRARSAPPGPRSATRTRCGASGRRCGRAAARSSPTTARSASAASPASRRSTWSTGSRRTGRSTSTPSRTATRPTSCSTTARSAWSSPGRGSSRTSSTAKVDFGVAPLPTFGGEPLTISAPDTWTIFDNGDARSKAAIEFVQWLNSPEQDAKWVTKAGSLPLRKGTAEQPAWAAYQKDVPGLSVFLDGARRRAREAGEPGVSEGLGGGRAVARRRPAQALRSRPTRCSRRYRPARLSLPAAAERRPSARCSGSSARRRPRGCGSRPRS